MAAMSNHTTGGTFDLRDRVALVSGASSGLGAHFASVLAQAGATVYLGARRVERVRESAQALRADGLRAHGVALDVTDADTARGVVDEIVRSEGRIDVLVNNAGMGLIKPALEHSAADWDHTLATNLTGAWTLAQAAGRHMVDAGSGSIVNIASLAGLGTSLFTAAYSASKAGLVHLTRQLALEWARSGVRVNAICPGHFPTELNQDLFDDPERLAQVAKKVPLGRIGELGDLDAPLLLLAGDGSRYITGVVIPVDGGQLVRPL